MKLIVSRVLRPQTGLWWVFVIAVLTLAVCAGCVSCPRVKSASVNRSIDDLFARWNKPDSPGCALAVIKEGKVIHERGYGCANLEYGTPITLSSVFNIASPSKQFTAMSVLRLVGSTRIVLQCRKLIEQPRAPTVNEQLGLTSNDL